VNASALLCSGNNDAGSLEEMDAEDTRAAAEAMACLSSITSSITSSVITSSSSITVTITITVAMLAVSSACHHHRGFRAGPLAVAFCARYGAWAMR
jgi:hypothetical protein